MSTNKHLTKQQCNKCDGCGLLPEPNARWSWKVQLCNNCNGYGFLLYNVGDKKSVAYDKDAAVASKFNIATSRIRRRA